MTIKELAEEIHGVFEGYHSITGSFQVLETSEIEHRILNNTTEDLKSMLNEIITSYTECLYEASISPITISFDVKTKKTIMESFYSMMNQATSALVKLNNYKQ